MSEEIENFIIPHASRNAERLAEELAKAAVEVLAAHGVKGLVVKPFSKQGFDIKNPDPLFTHLEFNITCTGWERELPAIQQNQANPEQGARDGKRECALQAIKVVTDAKPRREEARPVTPEGKPIFGEDSAWDVKSYLTAMGTSRQLSEDEAVEVMADTYEKAFESCLGNRSIRRFYALRAAYRALLAASAKGGK